MPMDVRASGLNARINAMHFLFLQIIHGSIADCCHFLIIGATVDASLVFASHPWL